MSLGHGDLKKKSETNWSSHTARPWDASGLVRGPKSRRRLESTDAAMNDEWATTHTSHLHYFESFNSAKLEQLREAAIQLEGKIKRATSGPLKIFTSVLKLVQK